MRLLGLDLGTKTLGIAITDKSNTLACPLKTIRYNGNYELLLPYLKDIIDTNGIDLLVLGLPKNMDNSLGFASKRSLDFKKILEDNFNIKVVLQDERLTTVEALNNMHSNNINTRKSKDIIDTEAAIIILDTYLRRIKNGTD